MIIVNKYADYSANSIGHVNIPFEDETATAIMAKYSKTISASAQTAFAHLIADLKASGLENNIASMILPFLAANGAEATMDAWRDVDSNYDASIHTGLHVGKYGVYYVQSEVNANVPGCAVRMSSVSAPITLASLFYAKQNAAGVYASAGYLWASKQYVVGGAPNRNIPFIGGSLVIGENIMINSCSTKKTSTCDVKGTFNGVTKQYSFSEEQISGNTDLFFNEHRVACSSLNYQGDFYSKTGQTAISIVFNKVLDETERQAVNTALHNFSVAVYENDIDTIM